MTISDPRVSASVDELQKLITGLAQGRDAVAGAIPPLASTTSDLTEFLKRGRRPLQGNIENVRPLATEITDRMPEVNNDIEQLGEDYLRLSALGAYGAYFNIYFCSVSLKINGPAGSDIQIGMGGQVIRPESGEIRRIFAHAPLAIPGSAA